MSDAKAKVAVLESMHWHVPLYQGALLGRGIEVVGVSDSTGRNGPELAKRLGCRSYATAEALLAAETVDFAFAFGRHVDMPALAMMLIERGIPFAIEKPCGVRAADVERLADAAEGKGLFVAVPFILRISDAIKSLRSSATSEVEHANFRFIGGPPDRYIAMGTPWMLDKAVSGGGALVNLGIHFVDLFRFLAGSDVVSVSAASTSRISKLSIEDEISVRLITAAGQIGTIEAGYTYLKDVATQRELGFSVRTTDAYYQALADGLAVRRLAANGVIESTVVPARMETDLYYAEFVATALADWRAGLAPFAGLRDAARALAIVEAAYLSAGMGGTPVAPEGRA